MREIRKALVGWALLLVVVFPLMASPGEPVARMKVTAAGVEWESVVDCDAIVLTIQTPQGEVRTETFASGRNPSLRVKELDLVDGAYTYELRAVPRVAPSMRARLAAARDDRETAALQQEAGLATALVQSGTISVAGGAFVVPQTAEAPAPASPGGGWWRLRPKTDETFLEDVYIDGRLCVGVDCTGTETFVFKTILTKENNNVLHFEDTSTSAGFASTDWRILMNDSFTGGANKFTIEDFTSSKVPFLIEGNTPTNSLYMDSTGRLGFGTNAPLMVLHANTTSTPGLRLEQNSGGGLTAQTWDVFGNHTFFVIRDVTGGNLHPFRIRPAAPTSSIDVASSGNVGLSCDAPTSDLVIASGAGCANPSSSINAGATQFTAASSRTFKENLARVDIPDVLDKMKDVDVYRYDFKQGPKDRLGLMAEDFHRIFGRGDDKYIDGNEVQMALWLAVKQLAAENDELRERLAALEKERD